jgi:hypothetical protein
MSESSFKVHWNVTLYKVGNGTTFRRLANFEHAGDRNSFEDFLKNQLKAVKQGDWYNLADEGKFKQADGKAKDKGFIFKLEQVRDLPSLRSLLGTY